MLGFHDDSESVVVSGWLYLYRDRVVQVCPPTSPYIKKSFEWILMYAISGCCIHKYCNYEDPNLYPPCFRIETFHGRCDAYRVRSITIYQINQRLFLWVTYTHINLAPMPFAINATAWSVILL